MKKTYEDYLSYLENNGLKKSVMHRIFLPNHCRWVCDLAETYEPKNILEIGRSKGHSLGLFKYLWPESNLYSVDIVHHKEVDPIVNLFNETGSITLIHGDISHLKEDIKFDLILIDGDHSYRAAKYDWDQIQKFTKSGTVILIDDLDHPGGCGKVFYEVRDKYKNEVVINERNNEGLGVLYVP